METETFTAPRHTETGLGDVIGCGRCQAHDHVELMVRETHHRVANALQLTSSVLRLQALGAGSDEARVELRSAHHRVESIAVVHRLLCDRAPDAVDIGTYLEGLVEGICGSWQRPACGARLSIGVEVGFMSAERATCIGMIVNELVSNAYKYAFPEGTRGEIDIRLAVAGNLFILEVIDDGIGFERPESAYRNGLGLRMVDAMARRLRGSYHREFEAKGAKAVISFPVADSIPSI